MGRGIGMGIGIGRGTRAGMGKGTYMGASRGTGTGTDIRPHMGMGRRRGLGHIPLHQVPWRPLCSGSVWQCTHAEECAHAECCRISETPLKWLAAKRGQGTMRIVPAAVGFGHKHTAAACHFGAATWGTCWCEHGWVCGCAVGNLVDLHARLLQTCP